MEYQLDIILFFSKQQLHNRSSGSPQQKPPNVKLLTEKGRKRIGDPNPDRKDRSGWFPLSMKGTRVFFLSLPLRLAQTNSEACHNVLYPPRRQRDHASRSGHEQLSTAHRIFQIAEGTYGLVDEIRPAGPISTGSTAALSRVALFYLKFSFFSMVLLF